MRPACKECGRDLLAPVSVGRGVCEACTILAGKEASSATMRDVDRRRAEQASNSGGRA